MATEDQTAGGLSTEVLHERLETPLERFDSLPAYAALRSDWARAFEAGTIDEVQIRAMLALERNLDGGFVGGEPNVAAMGLRDWENLGPDPATVALVDPEKRASRMLRKRRRPEEDDETNQAEEDLDPRVAERAACLIDAVTQIRALEAGLPPEHRTRLIELRVDLTRRLTRERRADAALNRALVEVDAKSENASEKLRASVRGPRSAVGGPAAIGLPSIDSSTSPYARALESAARLEAPLVLDDDSVKVLDQLRLDAEEAVTRALAQGPDGPRGQASARRARSLFAAEVALTSGRPATHRSPGAPDTLSLRRALEATFPRPDQPSGLGAFQPISTAPEVPLYASRGPRARMAGTVPAGTRLIVEGEPKRGRHQVRHDGRVFFVPVGLLEPAGTPPRAAWPQPLGPPPALGGAPRQRRPLTTETLSIGDISVDLRGRGGAGPFASAVESAVGAALAALPDRLLGKGQTSPGSPLRTERLSLVLEIPSRFSDPAARGRVMADQIADALLRSGATTVGELALSITLAEREVPDSEALLGQLAGGQVDTVADSLAAERKTLDGSTRSRLSSFFGHDFNDVMVFAGPMSGALARSLSAEAFTHGKMVFFDPKHFRTDTAHGEALLAHELAHTRQAQDDRSGTRKEAEALRAEAGYLDWVQPGGAPLAKGADALLEQDARRGGDARSGSAGIQRASADRHRAEAEGPRADTAEFEERVAQVLERVRLLVGERGTFESDRIGRLARSGVARF
ncbi:MAG: DUF4157 domain-containing protein [Myxococcales bacterium]|nr:DUF4157 domain-containing protein [Myxococcales bacterium]